MAYFECPQGSLTPLQVHINPDPYDHMAHQDSRYNGYKDIVNSLSLLHLSTSSLPPPSFSLERERRAHFNDRFFELYKLIPNPKKKDRAFVVKEATVYIKELLRTIEEFKILVEKKRLEKLRSKNKAIANGEEDQEEEEEEDTVIYMPQSETDQSSFNKNNNSLRCSLLKSKSKVTEEDVGIRASCSTTLRFVKDLVCMQVKMQTQRLKLWRDSTWKWFKPS